MSRTNTTAFTALGRPDAVTFTLPTPENPFATRISLPANSKWTPSPHWHERYVEIFRVLQGRARIIMDGVARDVVAADGEVRIERFVVHEFMRADVDTPPGRGEEEEVVVEERVEPADGTKEVFFRNILSILQDSDKVFGRWMVLQLVLTCAQFDNFDVYLSGPLQYHVTHAAHASARLLAPLVGLRPWYEEYTPQRLRDLAASQHQLHAKSA